MKEKRKEIIYGIGCILFGALVLSFGIVLLINKNYAGILFIILFLVFLILGIKQIKAKEIKEKPKKYEPKEAKKVDAQPKKKTRQALTKQHSFYSSSNYNKNLSIYKNKKNRKYY